MAKITKIKASDPKKSEKAAEKSATPTITRKKIVIEDKKTEKAKQKTAKKDSKPTKKSFILFRPFIALGRYLRDSWREIRQVRWPNRKTTWKMMLAVLVYTALFVAIISLLDILFSSLFNLILGKG